MYTAVKGIYENGVLIFTETPPSEDKSEVLVLFLGEENRIKTQNRSPEKGVVLGSLVNRGFKIPDDFNDPLEDFKDYM
ncbi:DUF2281 domain-containing protein [Dyadobacter sp. CY326]|uniref:DUF2281 domain-containing protein n=1 Tax=Dyadobacter sp. CY326 TaxID=2907300 RepID=UPI001F48DA6E|nr:DUF2281 domain-containing protein [Dyadobacter sp. CY326]MCE7067516.1 DUF2281 domain-containing protein [Dyadobacter sp. CY326]